MHPKFNTHDAYINYKDSNSTIFIIKILIFITILDLSFACPAIASFAHLKTSVSSASPNLYYRPSESWIPQSISNCRVQLYSLLVPFVCPLLSRRTGSALRITRGFIVRGYQPKLSALHLCNSLIIVNER
jgi:hypothetical protein